MSWGKAAPLTSPRHAPSYAEARLSSLGCRGRSAAAEAAWLLHCPSLGRLGEGQPPPRHRCHQPAALRAALAVTPQAGGEAGQKQPRCLRPYYKARVTSLLGSRNKAKPPQPLAQLSGLERSGRMQSRSHHLAPSWLPWLRVGAGERSLPITAGAAALTTFPAPPGHHWPSKPNQHALQISRWDVSHLPPSPLPPQNGSG